MKYQLTYEQAVSLLIPKEKRPHTLEFTMFGIMGCNVDKKPLLAAMKTATDLRLAEKDSRGYNHGHPIAFTHPKYKALWFVEADMKKVDAMYELVGKE